MVDELLPLMEPIYAKAKEEKRAYGEIGVLRNNSFQERYLVNLTKTTVALDDLRSNGDTFYLCKNLLSLKKYSTIEQLPRLGVSFCPNTEDDLDFLTTLTECGYADLFQKLGEAISIPNWINGVSAPVQRSRNSVQPYLITAAHSELSNLEIIKLSVERFGADVNIQAKRRIYRQPAKPEYVPGPTALHILSRGNRWWQIVAIKYLVNHGANMEIKDDAGL